MTGHVKRTLVMVSAVFGTVTFLPCGWAQSRGELLYSTHCVSCHTSEMHWRDNKAAIDWVSLKFQVRRWQTAASLGWSESDVHAVTVYLNESIYRYVQPADSIAMHAPRMIDRTYAAGNGWPQDIHTCFAGWPLEQTVMR